MSQTDHDRPVALFLSYSGNGGVERMMTLLARGIAERGHPVDLLVIKGHGEHFAVPAGVRVIHSGARHTWQAIPFLLCYLRRTPPRALLAAKDRANRVAILARRLAGRSDIPLVIRLGTHLEQSMKGKHPLRLWWQQRQMARSYRHADRVVAVSEGVAADTRHLTGLTADRVRVIRNPTLFPEISERAAEPASHPWLDDPALPVIVGIGRLTRQKDFSTLIRAFARLRATHPSRLLIFGEGKDRPQLQALISELGLTEWVDLPGFTANPYAALARARLFVLSSAWEGSPNVLVEAMGLGTPVVATDCESGPREILAGGRHGPLVPVGDAERLAEAMATVLDQPPPAAQLQQAVAEYSLALSTLRYLQALGVESPDATV